MATGTPPAARGPQNNPSAAALQKPAPSPVSKAVAVPTRRRTAIPDRYRGELLAALIAAALTGALTLGGVFLDSYLTRQARLEDQRQAAYLEFENAVTSAETVGRRYGQRLSNRSTRMTTEDHIAEEERQAPMVDARYDRLFNAHAAVQVVGSDTSIELAEACTARTDGYLAGLLDGLDGFLTSAEEGQKALDEAMTRWARDDSCARFISVTHAEIAAR